jgi:hypothetical protein
MARQIPPGRLEKRHGFDIGARRSIFMADVSLTLLVLKTRQAEQLRAFYQTLGVDLTESGAQQPDAFLEAFKRVVVKNQAP